MPRSLGRDRLAGVREGKVFLACEASKGWRARVPSTATSAQFPGTCVRWEEQLFEVEDLEARADGSVTYTLALWDERHAIRAVATYSPETEAARAAGGRDASRRVEGHRVVLLLAPLLGCLPGGVQERLENEYNVKASWMSCASALPLLLFGAFSIISARAATFGGPLLLPMPVLVLGQYLFFESAVRLAVALMQVRGIGTLPGTLLYETWCLARRGFDRAAGRAVSPEQPSPEVQPGEPWEAGDDRFRLLEPFLSFLAPEEQTRLQERFGFDGLKWGRISAIFLLVALGPFALTALLGFFLVPAVPDVLLFTVAGGVSIEQILRLRKVARKTLAPSILGVLIRPAARRLLDRTPLE